MADGLPTDETALSAPLFADGRHFLTLGSLGLLLAGSFAIFLAATGNFLPHDTAFLGMTPQQLCARDGCKIVHFMIHDRVSFGGTLISIAILYLWLIHFPLKGRRPWAWWTLLVSAIAGFASFLSYLGFGYLDTWHAAATVALLPCFVIGLVMTFRTLEGPRSAASLLQPSVRPARWTGRPAFGRLTLLVTSLAMFVAGLTITIVGMTVVFVPQDLEYMETTVAALQAINPHLIPLIAHDRAGFGGGVLNAGFLLLAIVWCAPPARHLWQAPALVFVVGFGTAIGIHPIVGYNNPVHLGPACLGAVAFLLGLVLSARSMLHPQRDSSAPVMQT